MQGFKYVLCVKHRFQIFGDWDRQATDSSQSGERTRTLPPPTKSLGAWSEVGGTRESFIVTPAGKSCSASVSFVCGGPYGPREASRPPAPEAPEPCGPCSVMRTPRWHKIHSAYWRRLRWSDGACAADAEHVGGRFCRVWVPNECPVWCPDWCPDWCPIRSPKLSKLPPTSETLRGQKNVIPTVPESTCYEFMCI
jgi:hypothetical protein